MEAGPFHKEAKCRTDAVVEPGRSLAKLSETSLSREGVYVLFGSASLRSHLYTATGKGRKQRRRPNLHVDGGEQALVRREATLEAPKAVCVDARVESDPLQKACSSM